MHRTMFLNRLGNALRAMDALHETPKQELDLDSDDGERLFTLLLAGKFAQPGDRP